ncbi:Hypothetical protein D9617_24g016140 [Elsinoe fawcettii]|nr:Hypothetical protein D9617_24g016140 [Elsinoe fawcettii]
MANATPQPRTWRNGTPRDFGSDVTTTSVSFFFIILLSSIVGNIYCGHKDVCTCSKRSRVSNYVCAAIAALSFLWYTNDITTLLSSCSVSRHDIAKCVSTAVGSPAGLFCFGVMGYCSPDALRTAAKSLKEDTRGFLKTGSLTIILLAIISTAYAVMLKSTTDLMTFALVSMMIGRDDPSIATTNPRTTGPLAVATGLVIWIMHYRLKDVAEIARILRRSSILTALTPGLPEDGTSLSEKGELKKILPPEGHAQRTARPSKVAQ